LVCGGCAVWKSASAPWVEKIIDAKCGDLLKTAGKNGVGAGGFYPVISTTPPTAAVIATAVNPGSKK